MFKKSLSSETGFTLLEILIALLVLSIGLLGIASLQTRGQQFNTAAYLYTQATYLATDLMERMRSNYDMVSRSGSGTGAITQKRQELRDAYSRKLTYANCPTEQKCDEDAGCTALELVEYDLSNWCKSLGTLPDGEAEITSQDMSVSLPGTTTPLVLTRYTITLKWWGVNQGTEDAEKKEQRWLMIQ
jgi:type IV pilus assembly protein PilV